MFTSSFFCVSQFTVPLPFVSVLLLVLIAQVSSLTFHTCLTVFLHWISSFSFFKLASVVMKFGNFHLFGGSAASTFLLLVSNKNNLCYLYFLSLFWRTFSLWLNPVNSYFMLFLDLCLSVSPLRLEVQCEVVDSEINHILPAFSVVRRECGLQREPLLFSCAGHSPKYRRLCPCRDFRHGQVALCRDCL